jgi:hypothetical protein
MVAALIWDTTSTALASTDRYIGASDADSGTRLFLGATGSGNHGAFGPNSATSLTDSAGGEFRGILSASRTAADARYVGFRSASDWSLVNSDNAASGALNSTQNLYALCQNNDGTPASFLRNAMAMGAIMVGLGITQAHNEKFSGALKTLWETCTGLTLP